MPTTSGGGIQVDGTARLFNSTLANNYGQYGGAINDNGNLTLEACTIAGNSATKQAGGLRTSTVAVTLNDTIVANNIVFGAASDISNTSGGSVVATSAHNLIGSGGSGGLTNGSNNNIVLAAGVSPDLGTLGSYGGPTQTVPLLAGGPAIGAGIALSGVTTDQRGLLRGNVVDIGAFQTSLQVESPSDSVVTTAAGLTLPGAVGLANQFPGTAITFDPAATHFATPQTITLNATGGRGGPLVLSDNSLTTTITGPAAGVTIGGGEKSGVLKIESGVTATLSGLTISGGSTSGFGGGLQVYGVASLTDCTISYNSAGSGGGLEVNTGGTVTLTGCTITGNQAITSGGGVQVDGTATLINSTLANNYSANGGAINDNRTLTLEACTVSGNSARVGVGGLRIYGGSATLDDTIVAGNIQLGVLSNSPSDINVTNPGKATGLDNLIGTGGSGGIQAGDGGNIVLTSLANLDLASLGNYGGPTKTMALLSGSPAIGAGSDSIQGVTVPTTDQRGLLRGEVVDIGAVQISLVVESSSGTIDASPAAASLTLPDAVSLADQFRYSAIDITFDPTAFATATTITLTGSQLELSNTGGMQSLTGPAMGVTISGGGLSRVLQVDGGVTASLSDLTISGGSATLGAGLEVMGTVTVTGCTFAGNTATTSGGGIQVDGTARLINSTLSGNSSANGGAINDNGTLTLGACTVSGNSAPTNAGGGLRVYGKSATAALTDSIVAGNFGSDIDNLGSGTTSGSNNLIGVGGSGGITGGSGGNIVLTSLANLDLAPLGSYGGPTATQALLVGSPAIGAGEALSNVTTDQRGLLRSDAVDIGAFQTSLQVESPADALDNAPAAATLTLRDAVSLADMFAGTAITFDPTVFTVSSHTIILTRGQLELTGVTESITGPATGLTIKGGGQSRVLEVDTGVTATLFGLTISGGSTSAFGGGVQIYGTAMLTDCTISGSSAEFGGGLEVEALGKVMVLTAPWRTTQLPHPAAGCRSRSEVRPRSSIPHSAAIPARMAVRSTTTAP